MTIAKAVEEVNPNQFDGVLWRCVGRDPEPKALSDMIGGDANERQRLHEVLSSLFVTNDNVISTMKTYFHRPLPHSETRFSDGSFPIIYSSIELTTAITERTHWANTGLGDVEKSTVNLEVFNFSLNAKLKDVAQLVSSWPKLVHPTDYGDCHITGAVTHADVNSDAIKALSARKRDRENIALLSMSGVGVSTEVRFVTIEFSATTARCISKDVSFDVTFDDVYSKYAIPPA